MDKLVVVYVLLTEFKVIYALFSHYNRVDNVSAIKQ